MKLKKTISNLLKDIEEDDVRAVVVSVLDKEDSIYSLSRTEGDNLIDTISLLTNHFLLDAETIHLASLLYHVKQNSVEDYDSIIEQIEKNTDYDYLEEVEESVYEMENGFSDEEPIDDEDDDTKSDNYLVC